MIPKTATQQYIVDVFQHAEKQPYRGGRISICIYQVLNKILNMFQSWDTADESSNSCFY